MSEAHIVWCWVEDWKKDCIKTYNKASDSKLLRKYMGLKIFDLDDNEVCTISSNEMYWYVRRKKGQWTLFVESPEYDGTNRDMLELYEIN